MIIVIITTKVVVVEEVLLLSCVQQFHDPMDCSLPASSVHGIFQARILKWVGIQSSGKSS